MPNELDELMARLEEDLFSCPDSDIDTLVAYYRNARAQAAAGVKPKKESAPKKDLGSIMAQLTPAAPPVPAGFKRRV